MRHLKSGRKLKRTKSHRKATLASLSVALIKNKKIKTTVAKAKEARMFVEKIITRAKNALIKENESGKKDINARRLIFAKLRDRACITTLFNEIAPKVISRPGGYTRVLKLGRRLGDGAELAVLELVDFNIAQEKSEVKKSKKKKEKVTTTQSTEKKVESQTSESNAVKQPETEVSVSKEG